MEIPTAQVKIYCALRTNLRAKILDLNSLLLPRQALTCKVSQETRKQEFQEWNL